jgi:NhaP-type Na+/H+ or K+/H+ antiporter
MRDIEMNPIPLFGDSVVIDHCPERCNGNGVCQRIYNINHSSESFEKERNQEKTTYTAKFICACKENFIGETCEKCNLGFYSEECLPCPRNPADHTLCGMGGVCDDGKEGSGKCVCIDSNNDPELFCQGVIDVEKHQESEDEVTFGFILLLLVAFLTTFMLYIYNVVPALHILPESVASIIAGILLGCGFKFFYKNHGEMLSILSFEPHTFFLFLLPPIMYEAGFSLRVRIFLKNLFSVLAITVLATLLASIIFSLVFWYGSTFTDFKFSPIQSLQFGCFISAIDPVATISIFKSLKVTEVLFTLVMGECVLNDAVAIALSYSVQHFADNHSGEEVSMGVEIFRGFISFCSLFIFSMLIGFFTGLLFSFLFKVLDMHKIPWIEIGIFILASYFPYILAEGFECSGLLAILIMAIIMRNYCFHSLSPVASISIEFLVEMACNMSENFLFCYLGISIPLMMDNVKISLIIVGVIALMVSRFLSIWITMVIINIFK